MNFLERRALVRVTRGLSHLMEPGEQILEFDIGRINDERAELIASDRAVYVRFTETNNIIRSSYREIAQIKDMGRFWGIRFISAWKDEGEFLFQTRAPRSGLMPVLTERMAALAKYSKTLDYPGGGSASFWYRETADGERYFWQVVPDDDVPEQHGAAFQQWMKETVPQLSREFGIIAD